MSRVKYIIQKRASLKRLLTGMENLIFKEDVDLNNLKLRMDRVKEQFFAYEELHDELALLEPDHEGLEDIDEIQNRYYNLASRVTTLCPPPNPTPTNILNTPSVSTDNITRRIKLPVAELPKFNGDLKDWLSFKNTFLTMIDAREDITDLQKFLYLKDSLLKPALDKILIYHASEENYKNAWNLLTDSYDKKRILISNHLDAIIDTSTLNKSSYKGLTKLVDDMKQHVNMLASLDVVPDHYILVRLLERALPPKIRTRWEENLDLDRFPTLDDMLKFISETAFRLFTVEQDTSHDGSSKRQHYDKDQVASKARKGDQGMRIFMTSTSTVCLICKDKIHPLFQCQSFKKLSIQSRWNFVINSKLCKNCLRRHSDKCTFSNCNHCDRYHHTLLHRPSQRYNFKQNSSTQTTTQGSSSGNSTVKKSL